MSVYGDRIPEHGSYVNPHPRPYERCTSQELIKLSNCCNEILVKLDDCKSDDKACECCALQQMNVECYNLCPGNPSNNFLTVLFDDCRDLNDINACALPFKKHDGLPRVEVNQDKEEIKNSVIVKSKLSQMEAEDPIGAEEPIEAQGPIEDIKDHEGIHSQNGNITQPQTQNFTLNQTEIFTNDTVMTVFVSIAVTLVLFLHLL